MITIARTIGWGLFCTSSWTWCIGMWLPLLLIERWGWPGFWVFAVPNVIGCAAMGYVVGSRERSVRMVESHRGAMRWFSCVSIAFQLFWITALMGDLGFIFLGKTASMVIIPGVVLLLAAAIAWFPTRGWLVLAAMLFAYMLYTFGMVGTRFTVQINDFGSIPSIQLWGAAPIIVLGFLTSPYLDLTFHRARQETPSPHSFAVFGIAFMAVLLFVTTYYHITPSAVTLVILFWFFQVIFTIGAHMRELIRTNRSGPNRWGSFSVLTLISLLPIPIVWLVRGIGGHAADDWLLTDTYLRFLGFYGLVVPVWVIAFMGPRPVTRSTPVAIILGITLLIAFVFAELGMVHTPTWWLLPAAGLALGVPLLTRAWYPVRT